MFIHRKIVLLLLRERQRYRASSKFIISPYHLRFLIPILPLLLERRCRDDNTIISKRTFYSVKKKKKEKKKRQSFVTL